MAKTSMKIKQSKKAKFSTQEYTRCRICGRPHAELRRQAGKQYAQGILPLCGYPARLTNQ